MLNEKNLLNIKEAIVGLNISADDSYSRVGDLIDESSNPIFHSSEVHQGVTKRCISFPQYKVVVKYSRYGYTEAEEEIQVYAEAEKIGIAFLFPETRLLVVHNGITFVIQEMVDYSCGNIPRVHWKTYENISRTVKGTYVKKMQKQFDKAGSCCHRTINDTWAKCVISLYGKNVAKTLSNFVVAQGINDLHYDNIGFINRKPVILDFSGYKGN